MNVEEESPAIGKAEDRTKLNSGSSLLLLMYIRLPFGIVQLGPDARNGVGG